MKFQPKIDQHNIKKKLFIIFSTSDNPYYEVKKLAKQNKVTDRTIRHYLPKLTLNGKIIRAVNDLTKKNIKAASRTEILNYADRL